MSGAGRRLSLQVVERPCACDAFLRLPWRLYRDDPAWIPPLLLERRQHLDPRHNPFFEPAETRFWIALRDGLPVGRISAQVNRAYLEMHDDGTGHFRILEAGDNPEVFAARLGADGGWVGVGGRRLWGGPFTIFTNE